MISISDSLDLHDSIILLKLARFVSSREQRSIRKDLIDIIPKTVDIRPDEWAKQKRFLLKFPKMNIVDPEALLKKISQLPGILTIIIFKNQNFNFPTENLSELVNYTLSTLKTSDKLLHIKFQAIGSIPFHKRAFKERISKKRPVSNESNETTFDIYLECKEENSKVLGRLGFLYLDVQKESKTSKKTSLKPITTILYSPFTTIEIADFCRISLNFDFLEVLFSNENEKVPEILDEASKTLFKGLDKVKYKVIPSLNDFIRNNREMYLFLGFSLHCTQNEQDLKKVLKETKKIPCIIIGNEVRGLEYKTQKIIDMFKLGTGSSEPLRASHVISYVLGMIV